MKKLLLLFMLVALFFNCHILNAEEFEVPENYELNSVEAYAELEDEIIEACDWLIQHDHQSDEAKQKEVSRFFMLWIIGSPNVSITIDKPFVVSNPKMNEAAFIFMAGWTKYALESRDFENHEKAAIAGIQAMIDHYKVVKEYIGKDDKVEEFIKLKEDGKLEEYVKKAFVKMEEQKTKQ